MNKLSLRGLGYGVLIGGLTLSSLATFTIVGSAVNAATVTDSSVRVAWGDEHIGSDTPNTPALKDLVFTVSQTANLGHQGIDISWSGGQATSVGQYDTNYLQIMQCWGDSGTPTPDQCQFGAAPSAVTDVMGANAGSRALTGEDPAFDGSSHPELEVPGQQAGTAYAYPFTNVRDGSPVFSYQTLFDANTTNEIDAARTSADGTGHVTFEVQTSLEAPHLGCGADILQSDGTTFPRACWLVIVPRGDHNPDGTVPTFPASVSGSPFSPSNWQERISIPLSFEPVSQSCPLGQAERRIVGSELVADAFTSWQPALCQSGTTFGYSMIGDGEARTQIVSDVSGSARMAFVSSPLDDATRKGTSVIYAPVVRSALVFAFNIDFNVLSDGDPEYVAKNGTRLSQLVLNQRLVAKMLTQSYRADNPGFGVGDSVLQANPVSITADPEFQALNPAFTKWNNAFPEGLMVALGSADAYRNVWQWIRSSPDATAFLNGTADDNGMRINPEYLALKLGEGEPADSFPKSDLSTFVSTNDPNEPGFGSLDLRPYYNDMQDTAYRTLRADGNVKSMWDPTKSPPAYKAIPPQAAGSRLMLSVTDASSAARFGLDVASITNANGDVVAPTTDSISAGIGAFIPSGVDGVMLANPAATASGIYPLSQLVYAAINACAVDAPVAADYAKVLTYAAGNGQTTGAARGQLPNGYVPLSDAEKSQTQTVAASLANVDALHATCGTNTSGAGSSSGGGSYGSSTSSASGPVPSSSPSATAAKSLAVAKDHIGLDTSAAAIGLAAGIPMCIAGPLMLRRARRLN